MASSQALELYSDPVSDELRFKKIQWLQRAQWLRTAILGANDGLLSTTSLMLGIGAVKEDKQSMFLSGFTGAIAGACSLAVGDFVSVSTQREIEAAIADCRISEVVTPGRSPVMKVVGLKLGEDETEDVQPNPYKAAAASRLAFLIGAFVPLASAAFVDRNTIRIAVISVVSSVALVLLGGCGAHLGGSPVRISAVRVLFGGWIAMAITYGLLKPFDDRDHHDTT